VASCLALGTSVRCANSFPSRAKTRTRKLPDSAESPSCDVTIEICHSEDVLARITHDFVCVISALKPFRLFSNPVPHYGHRNLPHDRTMLSDESNDCDHSVIRIAETIVGDALAHFSRFFPIGGRSHHQHGQVSISSRKFVAINIDETE
jgi:hypothetical protein